jgi:hypothetical protein
MIESKVSELGLKAKSQCSDLQGSSKIDEIGRENASEENNKCREVTQMKIMHAIDAKVL